MSEQTDEKRRFSRVPFDADIILTKDDGQWHSQLADISLKGVLIGTPDDWDGVYGERYQLEIIFAESGSLINVQVSVAHSENDRVGFEITEIDIESVSHLRRLMELNLGDPDLLDRELSALHWK
ncbi:PilZ domain-containing protein [Pseudomonadota bacterium]